MARPILIVKIPGKTKSENIVNDLQRIFQDKELVNTYHIFAFDCPGLDDWQFLVSDDCEKLSPETLRFFREIKN